MALKYNTNNVSDVVWHTNNQDYIVTVVKQNNTVVYARPGTYVTGTLPEHVTSLAATRAATIEPTASTGSIASGGTVYHGDTLNFVAVPETYWTMTYDTTHTINFLSTKSLSGVNAANIRQVMGLERNFKYRCDGVLVETLNITYKDRHGNATTLTRGNATNYYKNVTVGQPFAITYNYTIRQYYTCTITASNLGASDQEAVLYFGNTTALPRTFNYTLNDGVYRITTYYTNGSVAWSMTSSGSQTAEQPTSYTFGAVAATYWTNATVSPTQTGAGAATVSIIGTAEPYMLNANVNIGSGVSQITYTYSSTPTKRTTVTTNANASFNAWTGGSIEYSGTRSTYWTDPTSGTIDPSTSVRSVTVNASCYMRNVAVTLGSNVSKITLTYSNSSGTETSTDVTTTGNVSAWTGARIKWVATAAQYWTISNSGETAATESARSINTGNAKRADRTVSLYPSTHAIITASYTNTNNSSDSVTATRTNNSASNVWQGSGIDATLAVDTYCTGSLSATHANAGTGNVAFTANVSGLTKTFAVQIKNGNAFSNVSVTRYSSDFSAIVFTPNGVYNTYAVWQGGPITYTYTWTGDQWVTANITATNLGAGTGLAVLYFDTKAATRVFNYSSSTGHITKIKTYRQYSYYYDNVPGTSRTIDDPATWHTFSAVADSYWTVSSVSPTKVEAGLTTVNIDATASKLTRVIKFTPYGFWTMGGGSATITYVSPTGTATTNTTTVLNRTNFTTTYSLSVWQGGTVSVAATGRNSSWEVTGDGTSFDPGSASQGANIAAWVKPANFNYYDASYVNNWVSYGTEYLTLSFKNYTQYQMVVYPDDFYLEWEDGTKVTVDSNFSGTTINSEGTGNLTWHWQQHPTYRWNDAYSADIRIKARINGTNYTGTIYMI